MPENSEPLVPLDFSGRLFIHIGIHKTGTTSIQNVLHDKYEDLCRKRILYPRAGRIQDGKVLTLHHPLILALLGDSQQTAASVLDALRKEIEATAPTTIVLSSEVLAREYHASQVFRDLKDIFPQATRTWIVYLRRQDALAMSRYAEGIKIGQIAWPDGIRTVLRPELLDFRLRLERLQYAVQDDTIVPVSFDAEKNRLIAGFFQKCGITIDGSIDEITKNTALPWGELQLLRFANGIPGSPGRFARRLIGFLSKRISASPLKGLLDWPTPLSPQEQVDVRKRYEKSNRWVETTYWGKQPFLTGTSRGHVRQPDRRG